MAIPRRPDAVAAGAAVNVQDTLTAPGVEEHVAAHGRARASRPRCSV
ncbi:hypothetical protein OR263_24010 [Streptomyces sp. NEAU-H22]|nr:MULTISPECIES: hypothetical protein [unclassified Streptomyces]MCX3289736.1 hypothetical protein [Streptomyces sp. NEAU-H22]WMD06421.1 hypothetical protein Q7C01_19405 [Streptomyces sp. FXY-T5]